MNVAHRNFNDYVQDKVSYWKLVGKKFNRANIEFLKYPYLTSVNNAFFRGESVPRKNRIKAFNLKYQLTVF